MPLAGKKTSDDDKQNRDEQEKKWSRLLTMAQAAAEHNRFMEAERTFLQALELAQTFAPGDRKHHHTIESLAELYLNSLRTAQAENLCHQSLTLLNQLPENSPDLAVNLKNLPQLFLRCARRQEAEFVCQRQLSLTERQHGEESLELVQPLEQLALIWFRGGKGNQCKAIYERIVTIKEKALGPEHPEVASSLNDLAACVRHDDVEQWEKLKRRALSINEGFYKSGNEVLLKNIIDMALSFQHYKRYDEAEETLKRAIDLTEKSVGLQSKEVASLLLQLAALDIVQSKNADHLYERVMAIAENVDSFTASEILLDLGKHYFRHRSDKERDCLKIYQEALSKREESSGAYAPALLPIIDAITVLRLNNGGADFTSYCERALEILEKNNGYDHPANTARMTELAENYGSKKRPQEGLALKKRVLAIQEKWLGLNHLETGCTLSSIAVTEDSLSLIAEAIEHHERAEKIFIGLLKENYHSGLLCQPMFVSFSITLRQLKRLYEKEGRVEDAKAAGEKTEILRNAGPDQWAKLAASYELS